MWPFKKTEQPQTIDTRDVVTHDGEFYKTIRRASSLSVTELEAIAKIEGLLAINTGYNHHLEPLGYSYDFVKLPAIQK